MSQASQLSLIPNAAGYLTVAATSAPTSDQLTITNTGFPITTAGTNNLQLTFVGGAGAVEASSARVSITPGSTSGSVWNGFRVVSSAAALTGVTLNAFKVDSKSTGAGTSNVVYAGTGWDTIISYNGTTVVSGTGGLYNSGVPVLASQITTSMGWNLT